MTQLSISYAGITYDATETFPKVGATTWYKGQRVTVERINAEDYAMTMIHVRFADGHTGIFKNSELGLKADDIAKMFQKG